MYVPASSHSEPNTGPTSSVAATAMESMSGAATSARRLTVVRNNSSRSPVASRERTAASAMKTWPTARTTSATGAPIRRWAKAKRPPTELP